MRTKALVSVEVSFLWNGSFHEESMSLFKNEISIRSKCRFEQLTMRGFVSNIESWMFGVSFVQKVTTTPFGRGPNPFRTIPKRIYQACIFFITSM